MITITYHGEKLQYLLKNEMMTKKTNCLHQRCVEAAEAAIRNQSLKLFSIIRDITGKLTTNSVTNVNKRNVDPPANRDELVEEWGKYLEELLYDSSDLVDT